MVSLEDEYEMEKIVNHKKEDGKLYYLIKWKGYESHENTWEPEYHILDPKFLRDYKIAKNLVNDKKNIKIEEK